MTSKQMIKAEAIRMIDELIQAPYKSEFDDGRISAFKHMELFIDSMPEKPVDNDCGKAAERYAKGQQYALAVAYHFCRGAQWQKKQMMKNAVDGVVICDKNLTRGYRDILFKFPEELKVGDKVKMIIIKEDEK